MLKGPKRSFVVVVVLVVVVLGVESSSKNVPNGTKIVQGNKKCTREHKMCNEQKLCKGTKNVLENKKCASVAH